MFTATENLLLASLSEESRKLILSQCTPVALPVRFLLHPSGSVPANGYFLISGLASIVRSTSAGETAEVGIVGREGLVGATHLLGPAVPPTECFMQLAGSGLKMPFPKLLQLFKSCEEIRTRILEFVQQRMLNLSQLATCNRLHNAEERLARWLLMVDDRIQSDKINLTQEFLAQMLGAQRTTVTMVAGTLQRAGLIEYKRGTLHILNRRKLEAAACECYRLAQESYGGLYNGYAPHADH